MQGDSAQALDALADQAAAAIHSIHAPGAVTAASLVAARELHENVCRHASVHQLAFRLSDPARTPQVQHFGFQVLLTALKARPPTLGQTERAEARAWLASLLVGRAAVYQPYVRAKCAEVVSEVARLDWPKQWPELKNALLASAAGASPELASLALSVWCHIADLLIEDSKELTSDRRRELSGALTALVEKPVAAPELISSLQQALRQHGADGAVVREALNLCRALAVAVPVRALLAHSLDQIIRVGLDVESLRSQAVTALADWVEKVFPSGKSKGQPHPEVHDLARFTALLVQLSRRCVFDGTQQGYEFHRQVAELMSDYCTANAENLVWYLPVSDLGGLWSALLHLARYPSSLVQLDALNGMCQLSKAKDSSGSRGGAPPRPALEQLLGTCFVHALKNELMPAEGPASDRSEWLLRCLGAPSCSVPVPTFQVWCQFEAQTLAFDLREGSDAVDVGAVKVKSFELVREICPPSASPQDPEGFGSLCRIASLFVGRALIAGGTSAAGTCQVWVAEFDAALSLIERTATVVLKASEKPAGEQLKGVLEPALAFLQQVTMPAVSFSGTLEHRRMEFLSHWAVFYKHFDSDVVGQVLQRLIHVIESPPAEDAVKLQRRALDTLISLGKQGALRPAQLESLYTECSRLAGKLNPAARGKLIEALAAAVAACGNLEIARRSQIICGMMKQPTAAFHASPLAQSATSDALLAVLTGAAATPPPGTGANKFEEPNLGKLRDLRTLLATFTGVISKTATPNGVHTCGDNFAQDHVAAQVVQAWAPGIFAVARGLAGLSVLAHGTGNQAALMLLSSCASTEQECVLGKRCEASPEVLLPGFDARVVGAVRGLLWETQSVVVSALRLCMACSSFWALPDAPSWIRALVELLPSQRLHVANVILKEVFVPIYGMPASSATPGFRAVPSQVQGAACEVVVPTLVASIRQILRRGWGEGAAAEGPDEVKELMFATSVVAFSRTAAHLLAGLAGCGTPSAGLLANPERKYFLRGAAVQQAQKAPTPAQGPGAAGNKKKKNRSKNSFAALADDADAMADDASAKDFGPDTDPEVPKGAAAVVLRHREMRALVRIALSELASVPEVETVSRALRGLLIWSVQLWNLIARGEDPASIAAGAQPNKPPEVGELLHAAGDALRALPTGVLQPMLKVVAKPVNVASLSSAAPAQPSGDAFVLSPCATLVTLVEQSWSTFTSPTWVHGKRTPSGLVLESTTPVMNVIWILIKLFRIQCFKLDLKPAFTHSYLCPPLGEAGQLLRGLPNTTEHDVQTVLNCILEEDWVADPQKVAVRVLLHEASPAFDAGRQGGE